MMHKFGALVAQVLLVATAVSPLVSAAFGLGGIPLPLPSPPAQTAGKTGPYNVGVRQQSYIFQGRSLTYHWWYPANPASGASPFISAGGVRGEAVLNAPLDNSGGPYPLIMFSPGLGAYSDAYYFYTQNLASNGYIVVSMEHLDTKTALPTLNPALTALATSYQDKNDGTRAVLTTFTEWFRTTQFALTYRAQEIQFGLDKAIGEATDCSSPFLGAIDTDKIGMAGHSLGGYYTLLVGGGMPIYCDYPMTLQESNILNPVLAQVNPCAFPAKKLRPDPFALRDPRIKAVIALAPPSFIKESQMARSAGGINKPMLMLTGDDLKLESTRTITRTIYDNAGGPSYWVMVSNTSHYLVGDAYQLNPGFSATMPSQDKEDFVQKAEVYMKYSTAFFNTYVKGNTSEKAKLHNVVSPFVADLDYRD